MAQELSRTSPAFLTLTPEQAPHPPLAWRVNLTTTGAAIVGGKQDRVEVCGIDRWLGGVHLQSGARAWRWDPVRARIT